MGREQYSTHRMAYEAFVGAIPEGQWVLHRCDNPPCIRPDHLFLGDAQANSDDMVSKDRQAYGELADNSKLTDEILAAILFLAKGSRHTSVAIAKHFGVSSVAVDYIVRRETWTHVAPADRYDGPPIREWQGRGGENNSKVILTEVEVRTIKRLLLDGVMSMVDIGRHFGVTKYVIFDIKRGRSWADVEALPIGEPIIFPDPAVIADRLGWQRIRNGTVNGRFKRRL